MERERRHKYRLVQAAMVLSIPFIVLSTVILTDEAAVTGFAAVQVQSEIVAPIASAFIGLMAAMILGIVLYFHWPVHINVVHTNELEPAVSQQLKAYVSQMKNLNKEDEEIKKSLHEAGWKSEVIDKIL